MTGSPAAENTARPIVYASAPSPVSMTDHWYEIASLDHFWIRRRFEVLQRFAGSLISRSKQLAEVGCGNGLLQRQVEDSYRLPVTGFDLNEFALKRNVSRTSPLYCYDIGQKSPEFESRFDLIFLFDVLEHIRDEDSFLRSVQFHLAESGSILLNVPSHQTLYSKYDRAAGHVRRYSAGQLKAVALRNGLVVHSYTYWGIPLMPLLILRKAMLVFQKNEKDIIASGLDPGSRPMNRALLVVSRLEPIPQRFFGTSLMAVLGRT